MPILDDFGVMYRSHQTLVYRTAYRITGNPADAEDVLQILFLRLLQQQRQNLEPNPRAYLHRASVNIALDIVRLRKPNVDVDEHTGGEDPTINAGRLRELLRIALGRLSPKLAEMFVLRHIEGYDNAEIAQMFETSTGTVAVLLSRARAQLRQSLAGENA